jgi:hypothetical protein
MKKHLPNTLIILFLSYPLLAQVILLNDVSINAIFKKMREVKELYDNKKMLAARLMTDRGKQKDVRVLI